MFSICLRQSLFALSPSLLYVPGSMTQEPQGIFMFLPPIFMQKCWDDQSGLQICLIHVFWRFELWLSHLNGEHFYPPNLPSTCFSVLDDKEASVTATFDLCSADTLRYIGSIPSEYVLMGWTQLTQDSLEPTAWGTNEVCSVQISALRKHSSFFCPRQGQELPSKRNKWINPVTLLERPCRESGLKNRHWESRAWEDQSKPPSQALFTTWVGTRKPQMSRREFWLRFVALGTNTVTAVDSLEALMWLAKEDQDSGNLGSDHCDTNKLFPTVNADKRLWSEGWGPVMLSTAQNVPSTSGMSKWEKQTNKPTNVLHFVLYKKRQTHQGFWLPLQGLLDALCWKCHREHE